MVEIGLCAVLEVEDGMVAEQGGAFAFGVAGAGRKVDSDRFDLAVDVGSVLQVVEDARGKGGEVAACHSRESFLDVGAH